MTEPSLPESNTSLTYTTPSSLPHLTHTPIPTPKPNQILIKIHFSAINPVDIQLQASPLLGLIAGTREKGIGRDYAGTIIAIGSSLQSSEHWRVGDEVFGLCNRPLGEGTFARYICVDPARDPVARKPQAWSREQAAAVPLVALTAFACLDWLPRVGQSLDGAPGTRHVVVNGASGGVGMWCVQLAKKVYGCRVTGICSGRNAEFVGKLGADVVVDYGTQDVAEVLLDGRPEDGKYDLYVDCVGGTDMFVHWRELLHTEGAYVTIVGDKTSRTALGGPLTYFTYPAQVWRSVYGYFFGPRYANVMLYQKSELLQQIAELADSEKVQVVVQDVVKGILSEEGHREAWKKVKEYMVGGRVRGKILVETA